jgi:hypothetical protein
MKQKPTYWRPPNTGDHWTTIFSPAGTGAMAFSIPALVGSKDVNFQLHSTDSFYKRPPSYSMKNSVSIAVMNVLRAVTVALCLATLHSTVYCNIAPYSVLQHCTVQCIVTLHSTVSCNITQYSVLQHCTVQCLATLHSTAYCNITQ